jgi:hypothetical protein
MRRSACLFYNLLELLYWDFKLCYVDTADTQDENFKLNLKFAHCDEKRESKLLRLILRFLLCVTFVLQTRAEYIVKA